jgi:hypothetical protein
MAETIAECISASVAAVTRAANVDAFRPCSACSVSAASIMRARSSSGLSPVSI